MKSLLVTALLFLSFEVCISQHSSSVPDSLKIQQLVRKLGSEHPRIMIRSNDFSEMKAEISGSKIKSRIHSDILKESERILTLPQLERIQIGIRLLDKSRESLRRIFFLSYAYRSTLDARFLKRAEEEIVTVSNFSDWNPSHFLDVGEMTMAVAIGYDWLFNELTETTKELARQAIIQKGLEPSYNEKFNWFVKTTNNWNQVCHAGMVFGALAIAEKNQELSARVIQRAIEFLPNSMQFYAPDGAYPEGYMYWDYGTTFNVLLIDALEKAFGSDFGLSQQQGFLESASYIQHMIGPTLLPHNWGDATNDSYLSPAVFWFANKRSDTSILWFQNKIASQSKENFSRNRVLPALLLWSKSLEVDKVAPPVATSWSGQGKSPVGLMRTSWTDPNAFFVGFKAGSASVSHAHMDAGSFVIDALGERWALDFGMQSYHSLESKGVRLWDMRQNSERWKVFRYNNFVHNTLTVDDALHNVNGYSKIERESKSKLFFTTDLTEVLAPALKKAERGIKIVDNRQVIVRDEILPSEKGNKVRWSFLTPASVNIIDKNIVELTRNGKTMYLHFLGNSPFTLKTWSTKSENENDAPNGDTILVGFESDVAGNKATFFEVSFSQEKKSPKPSGKGLADW
jgi:hypothetical protein